MERMARLDLWDGVSARGDASPTTKERRMYVWTISRIRGSGVRGEWLKWRKVRGLWEFLPREGGRRVNMRVELQREEMRMEARKVTAKRKGRKR